MDENENNVNLMNKKIDDLTVGDALKINLVVIAATIGIPVVTLVGMTAVDSVKKKLRDRKTKNLKIVTPAKLEK